MHWSISVDTSSPANVMSPSDSNSQTMSESEKLRSHGITFRDPETGVLYVQMQLLQVGYSQCCNRVAINCGKYNAAWLQNTDFKFKTFSWKIRLFVVSGDFNFKIVTKWLLTLSGMWFLYVLFIGLKGKILMQSF